MSVEYRKKVEFEVHDGYAYHKKQGKSICVENGLILIEDTEGGLHWVNAEKIRVIGDTE